MLNPDQTIKLVRTSNPQRSYPSNEFSEINVPVPSTPPSVTGSDLFYFIIALTIFTSVTLGAIARLAKIILQVKTPDDGEEDGKVGPEAHP